MAERDAAFARLTAIAMLSAPVTGIEDSLLNETPAVSPSSSAPAPTVRVAEAERTAAERRIDIERIRTRPTSAPASVCVASKLRTPPP